MNLLVVVFLIAFLRVSSIKTDLKYAILVMNCVDNIMWTSTMEDIPLIFHVSCLRLSKYGQNVNGGCGESLGLLEFVIKYYDRLTSIADFIIFTHGHVTSWHYPIPISKQIEILLNHGNYVSKNDIGAVYCGFNNGYLATSAHKESARFDPIELWSAIYNGTEIANKFPDVSSIRFPCCSTMFVKTKAIVQRSLATYKRVFENILHVPLEWSAKGICGRLTESSWHILLANVTQVNPPPYCNNGHIMIKGMSAGVSKGMSEGVSKDMSKGVNSNEWKRNKCKFFAIKYEVIVGSSWGKLQLPLQEDWKELRCDDLLLNQ